jgi:hypothetical protein
MLADTALQETQNRRADSMLPFSGYAQAMRPERTGLTACYVAMSEQSLTNEGRGRTEEDTKKGTSPDGLSISLIARFAAAEGNWAPRDDSDRRTDHIRFRGDAGLLGFTLPCANVPSTHLLTHQNATRDE